MIVHTESGRFPFDFAGPDLEAVLQREIPVLVEGGHVCFHVSPYSARVPGVDLVYKERPIIPFRSRRVPELRATRLFQVKPRTDEKKHGAILSSLSMIVPKRENKLESSVDCIEDK